MGSGPQGSAVPEANQNQLPHHLKMETDITSKWKLTSPQNGNRQHITFEVDITSQL
jgi:hypothetical protein